MNRRKFFSQAAAGRAGAGAAVLGAHVIESTAQAAPAAARDWSKTWPVHDQRPVQLLGVQTDGDYPVRYRYATGDEVHPNVWTVHSPQTGPGGLNRSRNG